MGAYRQPLVLGLVALFSLLDHADVVLAYRGRIPDDPILVAFKDS